MPNDPFLCSTPRNAPQKKEGGGRLRLACATRFRTPFFPGFFLGWNRGLRICCGRVHFISRTVEKTNLNNAPVRVCWFKTTAALDRFYQVIKMKAQCILRSLPFFLWLVLCMPPQDYSVMVLGTGEPIIQELPVCEARFVPSYVATVEDYKMAQQCGVQCCLCARSKSASCRMNCLVSDLTVVKKCASCSRLTIYYHA
jgi:hypothetical protein